MHGKQHRSVSRQQRQRLQQLGERFRVIDVGGPVQRRDRVPTRREPVAAGRGQRARGGQGDDERVDHHIPDELHPRGGQAFLMQIRQGVARRCEEQIGQMIGHDAVELFGHRAVTAPQARFHVTDGYAQLRRHQRGGHGRVHVAIDQHDIRCLLHAHRLETLHDRRGLFRV